MKYEKTATGSKWVAHLNDRDVPIEVKTYGDIVYVTVEYDGETIERRGRMTVERTILSPVRIIEARVESLLGDVVGKDRSMRRAAEDYASKVAIAVVDERRRAGSRQGRMRWIADQADYVGRLARLPWTGDEANLRNIERELESTLRAVKGLLGEEK